jgi:glycosyltransferase involved in cell wall biosynthesis
VRVLHVLTLVGGGGAFGGPVSIAREQCVELARRGHEVTLAAGWDGVGDVALDGTGVTRRLFGVRALPTGRAVTAPPPQRTISRLVSPGLVGWLRENATTFDLAHVHLGRDLISQSAAAALRRAGIPYIAQTHGMITADARLRARVLDAASVGRSIRRAGALLALNHAEADELTDLFETTPPTTVLPNGIAAEPALRPRPRNDRPEVLFVGRLHPRKRVLLFVEAAAVLRANGVRARFAIVGPDQGDLAAARQRIERLGLDDVVTYEGTLPADRIPDRMAAADVLVVPSAIEPFGMVALEAMTAGVPVVMTDTCDLAGPLRERGAAEVRRSTPHDLAEGVAAVLGDERRRAALVAAGRAAIDSEYSIRAVVDRLERVYAAARHPVQGVLL